MKHFFFQPFSPLNFGYYRIGIGLVALLLSFLLYPSLYLLFGQHGLVIWEVTDALASPCQPTLGRLYQWVNPTFLNADSFLYAFFFIYQLALLIFILGWKTPYMAFLAWLMHLTLMNTCRFGSYGVESMLNIALLYAIFFPCGRSLSIDSKGKTDPPDAYSRLSLRVLQLQLCIIYTASGMEKAFGAEWWDGNAIWYSLTEEQFRQFDFFWLSEYTLIAKILGWWTLLIEIGYALFVWYRPTSRFWIIQVLLLHLGIFIFMGLYTFALIMIVFNISAFAHLFSKQLYLNKTGFQKLLFWGTSNRLYKT
jgi:hypothetical protein